MKDAQMTPSQVNTKNTVLYMALELSNSKWKIMFSNGFKRRQKTITAGDLNVLQQEISRSREHLKLPVDAKVFSCYEAGRTGFGFIDTWLLKIFTIMWWTHQVSK